jgi:hypothetical protein
MVGHINIIEKSTCDCDDCNCGWNLFIGGTDKEDLEKILNAIKKHNQLWADLLLELD